MKVLIVDDEIDLCLLLKSYFQRKGYEVAIAYTLASGLDQLKTFSPDILFLDNYLPDGLGIDFIHYVREQYPKTKVVVITAHDSMRERERAIAEGAVEFIGKPFTVESITNTLEKINLKG